MGQIKLGLSMWRMGYHVAAWRHPEVPAEGALNFDYFLNIVKTAERGLFDLVFLADELAVRGGDNPQGARCRSSNSAEFEPITLLSALAPMTTHIGLVATGSTTYSEPYNLARQFLSLDHLSGGRAGWNVVTSWGAEDALNFGHLAVPDYELRYERAGEFLNVVRGLWNSWDADAFVRDKQSGIFYDPAKLHVLEHKGKYFSVRGPLNVARSPQDEPVVFFAGDSEPGREIAAASADVVFTAKQDLDDAQDFYASVKSRLAKSGRSQDDLIIMPGLMPIVGHTRDEAQAKYDQLQSLIDPIVGLASLYDRLGDLSDYPLDGPVPEPKDPKFKSRAEVMYRFAQRENYTIRQLYMAMASGRGHRVVIGTPADIVDEMESWREKQAADGYNIIPTHLPSAITDFVDLVVPEMQRRGIYRTQYEGRTLRDNLGLQR
jgi:N-acetyl-S-(2-succino)cysteine monooxygenase